MDYDKFSVEKSKSISWGKVGDYIDGTVIKRTPSTTPDQWGNTAVIYEILADGGVYHERDRDEEGKIIKSSNPDSVKVNIEKGETITVWAKISNEGRKEPMLTALERLPIGAYCRIKFTETKPSDKGNDAKIKQVFTDTSSGSYKMNEEWLESQRNGVIDLSTPVADGTPATSGEMAEEDKPF